MAGDSVTFVRSLVHSIATETNEHRGCVGAITLHDDAIFVLHHLLTDEGYSNNVISDWCESRLDSFTGFNFRRSMITDELPDNDKERVSIILLKYNWFCLINRIVW